jgi:VanZ family protein
LAPDRITAARKAAGWLGWAVLAFVAFATLSPIGMRPHVAGVHLEHVGAFAVIGFLFAFAYPRRAAAILLLAVGAAVLLEWGQTFLLTRHGRVDDAVEKIVGAVLGVAAAYVLDALLARRRARC